MYSFNWQEKPKEQKSKKMKQFINFIKKEFIHIIRDKRTLFILIAMPMMQILIFGFALTNEVKNTHFAVIDLSKDEVSKKLISQMNASSYFEYVGDAGSYKQLESSFRKGKIRLGVIIPENFGKNFQGQMGTTVQFIADASDPNVANTLVNYATAIVGDFEKSVYPTRSMPYSITTETRMMYNPQLKGAYNFVPGVMAMVLLLVCTMMTALTVVREKELGTMEIMLVSPVKPIRVIIAKAIPYLIVSFFNITSILLLSTFVLDVPIKGNIILLFSESILFTILALSLGLLISSTTDSQQTAMFISLVGMFLPTIMLSGFMFPIENMPLPLRIISNIVPAKWYFIIVRSVMIKGVGLKYVWKETLILIGMSCFFMMMAIKKFKLRLG
jgi:ABC-2 type transport system permease protein